MRFNRRVRRAATLLLLTSVAIAGCSSDNESGDVGDNTTAATTESPDSSSDPSESTVADLDLSGVTLKVAYSKEDAQTIIRDEAGAFEGTEYAIEWVELSGSNATLEALNAGAIDMALGLQAPSLVLAQANSEVVWTATDAVFKVVAAWEHVESLGFSVIVHADSGIESVADLAGRKVAFAKGTLGQYLWLKLQEEAGLSEDDVEEVVLPASEGRAAYRAGQVDALITGHRNAVPLLASDNSVILQSSDRFVPYLDFTVSRAELLDDPAYVAAIADFVSRVSVEERWLHDNTQVAAEMFADVFDIPLEDAVLAAELAIRTRRPIDDRTIAVLEEMGAVFYAAGVADTEVDVRIAIDLRFDDGVDATT